MTKSIHKNTKIERVDRNESHPLYFVDQAEPATRRLLTRKEKLQKRRDKANRNQLLEERKTVINPDFWDRFLLLAKVVYMRDEEADLYDVFEIYRTKFMGGWETTPEQLSKLDALIAKEDLKYGFSGA